MDIPLYEMVGAIRSPPQRESNIKPIIIKSEQKREEPNGEKEIMSTSSESLEWSEKYNADIGLKLCMHVSNLKQSLLRGCEKGRWQRDSLLELCLV